MMRRHMTRGRGPIRPTPRRHEAGVVGLMIAIAMLALPAGAFALTLANPPALAHSGFSVKVKGAKGPLSLYLSPERKPGKGDVALGKVKAAHGAVRVKIG